MTEIINADYLARLRGHLGAAVFDELMRDCALEIVDKMAEIERCAATEDAERVAGLVHDLVGLAGHCGLGGLSAAAADYNRACRAGAGPDALDALAALARRSTEALKAEIGRSETGT